MVEVLAAFPGTQPEAVTTTLDIEVQEAVEEVIAAAPEPAAVVVVDVATEGSAAWPPAPCRASTGPWAASTRRGPRSRW